MGWGWVEKLGSGWSIKIRRVTAKQVLKYVLIVNKRNLPEE